jgi:hypothetical protein
VRLLVFGKSYDLGKQCCLSFFVSFVFCLTLRFLLRMDNRFASAQWERQREREASLNDEHIDDFVDTGSARNYFQTNRERILHHFAGTSEHAEGTYDWYASWEKWARQQWEQQQQQGYAQQQQQQQQRARRPRQQAPRPKTDFVWDFDPSDP